jgi:uncharacterized cupredoxin-like copper-binding protein
MTAALVLAACGGDSTSTTMGDMEGMDHEEHSEFAFGEPAAAGDADRTIELDANDDFTFDPSEIEVAKGEIITFRVVNTGSLPHDFVLGDVDTQDTHEAEMVEMMEAGEMMMHDEANALSIPAGETKEITWHFTESGSVLIGCHQTGHYSAGMKATVSVSS